jgi:hypothetical protein
VVGAMALGSQANGCRLIWLLVTGADGLPQLIW